jgi:hypothetical protein
MSVRAKFTVQSITSHAHGQAKTVRLNAVCADEVPENQRYHRYTPSGSLEITIDNPAALEQFELGKSYYLDFTPAS